MSGFDAVSIALLEELGLKPSETKSITYHHTVGEVPTIEVTQIAIKSDIIWGGKKFKESVKLYEIQPRRKPLWRRAIAWVKS